MKLYFAAAALLTMLSCQESANKTAESTEKDSSTAPATAPVAAGPQCFTRISGKDTSYLQFETTNEAISGQLEYRLFEKDKNQGTITGTIANNILEAQYSFMSEGVTSVRPVVFKLENNQAFEAIPSSINDQGIPVFEKDAAKLKFEETPFVKGDCK
ncbi:hypothetical protein [Chitinophaga agri]|uniref:Copper resistance protein NlpE n=1 Tax=Chitinophaga agri TaxID=2703787 RepID=A0A6B9ZMZ8_9BACT|nr:hypothetical protein [Chitinophaga agri]QHS62013.1 hypothetical protein GWR21_21110 [Chitinophaga agri]